MEPKQTLVNACSSEALGNRNSQPARERPPQKPPVKHPATEEQKRTFTDTGFIRIFISCLLLMLSMAANRTVAQTYLVNSAANGYTHTTCAGTVYDGGGSSNNYAANSDYTVTFCSDNGGVIEMDFTSFAVNSGDNLFIHDGSSTADVLVAGAPFSAGNVPGTVTASTNCLTLRFVSNGSGQAAGWNADISCLESDCAAPTFDFENPTHESGTAGSPGAVYRFSGVLPGVDALLSIISFSHPDISIVSIDEEEATNGGYDWAFQPIIDYNWYNGEDNYDPAGDRYVVFEFDFVDAATGEPLAIPQVNMTAVDVDGNGESGGIREFVEASGFSSYELQTPTDLSLNGSLRATGPPQAYDGVVETALNTMISYSYLDENSLTVTYGASYDGAGSHGAASEARMNCLFFKCYDFNTAVICPTVEAAGGGAFCTDETATLTAVAAGGEGTCTMQWQVSLDGEEWVDIEGANNATHAAGAIIGTVYYRAAYTCTGQPTCGTVYSNMLTVIKNENPSPNQTGDIAICEGTGTTIAANATGGTAPYIYNWDNGLGTGTSHTVSPVNSTIYTVTVTDDKGCTGSGQVMVTVNTTPTVNAGQDETICRFTTTTIEAVPTGAQAPYTFNWSNGLGNSSTHTVGPMNTTTYSVTLTSGNGCVATDQVTITPETCIEICDNGMDDDGDGKTDCADSDCGPTMDPIAAVNSCIGETVTLVATATGGGGAGLVYSWSHGLGDGSIKEVSPLVTTVYSVTVTAPSGCTSTTTATVNVVLCPEDCTDGVDNDGDGLVDCDDPDCQAVSAPILTDDTYTTCPGMPYSDRVTYNDENLQNPSYSIASYPSQGIVTIDWTGKFYYTPVSMECGTDQFVYRVCNQATGCCSEATVTMVLGDDTPPTLVNVPADLTIGCDDQMPAQSYVSAYDNCPGIYVDFSEDSDQYSMGGCETFTVTRTWTATDLCGNVATGTQTITVLDQTKPEIFQLYTLPGGQQVIAGVANRVTQDWKYIPFPVTMSGTPVIFTTVVSDNDPSAVNTRIRFAHSQGFHIRLFEEEGADGSHQPENIAWIAIESGTNDEGTMLEAGRWDNINSTVSNVTFSDLFGDIPGLITSIQTTNDENTGSVRLNNIATGTAGVFIQEEQSADAETAHGYEHLGYLAFEPGKEIKDFRDESFAETGTVNLTNAWTFVQLDRSYTKPVVILGGVSGNDPDPVNVRVRNVTANSFEVRLQEWDYQDGSHAPETVSWIVMEGAIPGNQHYYCAGSAGYLQPGVNIFAVDNCDNQAVFGYSESPSVSGNGTLTIRNWMAVDDCGNMNIISRYDTCSTAALSVRAFLYGGVMGTGSSVLMRDDLRSGQKVPVFEPYSQLPAFSHVENHNPDSTGDDDDDDGGNDDDGNNEVPELPPGALNATFRTIADGDWTDGAIWSGGTSPGTQNINNKTISVEHQVTLPGNDIYLMNNTVLYVTNGGLTLTDGEFNLQGNSQAIINNSRFEVTNNNLINWSGSNRLDIKNSEVLVGNIFSNWSGTRKLENVCVSVGNAFSNEGSLDSLINCTVEATGSFANKFGGQMYISDTRVKVTNNNFTNENACSLTGNNLTIWTENGNLVNNGDWQAPVIQYCSTGLPVGLLGLLPLTEDCTGLPDYFNGCVPVIDPIDPDPDTEDDEEAITAAQIAGPGTINPVMLSSVGDDAIVDWMLVELRAAEDENQIVAYATALLQRDGDIVSEDGSSTLNFPEVVEGDYYVCVRHRNHLGLISQYPIYLSVLDPPMVDFTDPLLPTMGGYSAGRMHNGKRTLWGGDFNEDGKVIYQGPNNDVFYLFSRVLADEGNAGFLANYIVDGYDLHDMNLDGKVIYQGPNNDRAPLLYHSVLSHPGNAGFLANFIVDELLP